MTPDFMRNRRPKQRVISIGRGKTHHANLSTAHCLHIISRQDERDKPALEVRIMFECSERRILSLDDWEACLPAAPYSEKRAVRVRNDGHKTMNGGLR